MHVAKGWLFFAPGGSALTRDGNTLQKKPTLVRVPSQRRASEEKVYVLKRITFGGKRNLLSECARVRASERNRVHPSYKPGE